MAETRAARWAAPTVDPWVAWWAETSALPLAATKVARSAAMKAERWAGQTAALMVALRAAPSVASTADS